MSKVQKQLLLLALLLSGIALASPNDEPLQFSSGPRQVPLLELFTSEGCSSCPPADRWLSQLKTDPRLWKDVTPIAFHVDYWDHIGWKDRFAQSKFSDRQQRYAAEGGTRFVYTPGFFVNGSEWQGWRGGRVVTRTNDEVGNLSISVDERIVSARFDSHAELRGELILHVAVLGMNLESRVSRGENTGKTLRHDFVALGIASASLDTTSAGYKALIRLPEVNRDQGQHAIVAWVSDSRTQSPIQSVGGLLPKR